MIVLEDSGPEEIAIHATFFPQLRTSEAARSAPRPPRPRRWNCSSRSPTTTITTPTDTAPEGPWLNQTLEQIVAQLRRAFDLSGCAFLVVDWEERYIRPAAAWFSSRAVREALGAVLSRPYDPERAGITEAAIETRAPLLIGGIESWPGAAGAAPAPRRRRCRPRRRS